MNSRALVREQMSLEFSEVMLPGLLIEEFSESARRAGSAAEEHLSDMLAWFIREREYFLPYYNSFSDEGIRELEFERSDELERRLGFLRQASDATEADIIFTVLVTYLLKKEGLDLI